MKVKESELKEIENTIEKYKDSNEETLYSLIYAYGPREERGTYTDGKKHIHNPKTHHDYRTRQRNTKNGRKGQIKGSHHREHTSKTHHYKVRQRDVKEGRKGQIRDSYQSNDLSTKSSQSLNRTSGRQIFKEWEKPIYKKICCEYNKTISENEELATIILSIVSVSNIKISNSAAFAAILALIIIKKGISRFCSSCESKYGLCTN